MRADLVRFINNNLLHNPGETFSVEDSLIERGLLDSIGLMQIMQFLEERTALRIPDHMVTPDNFQSIAAIEEMIAGLRSASSHK